MGAVYLAEREEGEFQQRVAVKRLHRGLETPEALARFQTERQILARLSHPSIARLFDGGTTEDGRPYLVMELIEGRPIDEYSDAGRLSTRARLALLRETSDGFRIAEEDLRLRGPGEILGTRQSGEVGFRLATPEQVAELAPLATSDAQLLLDRDGGLEGPRGEAARTCLYLFERDAAVGLLRSG